MKAADQIPLTEDAAPPKPRNARRWIDAARARWRLVLIVAVTVLSTGLAAAVYYFQCLPDQQVDSTSMAAAKKAAEEGTVAVLSYSPEKLTDDIATAKSHLTGDFLNYYTHFTDQVFASAAQQQQVTTTAVVLRSAVSEMGRDSAVVLLFVDKHSVSKANPAPASRATTVRATMKKVDGSWLIEKFDPL
jgi:Mce-associated membrane protein